MARLGKQKNLILLLLAVIALQFVGLTALLLADSRRQAPEPVPALQPDVDEPGLDETIPAWLEPAAPEPVREKAPPEGELSAAEILFSSKVVAHGLGSAGGEAVLNCLEGFQAQYARGARVFEVDLRMTSDLQVVLRHDWRGGWQDGVSETAVPTLEEFLEKPVLGRYTPLSFRDLLLLMEEYPDICIVTDTKFTDAEIVALQFGAMLQDAKDLGLSYLFDRVVIQVYSELSHRTIDSIHHFPYYIYTLYAEGFDRAEETFREKAEFCRENGILGITMWDYWWKESFAPIAQEYGVAVFVHTVNDAEQALSLLDSGVSAVYTDSLAPGDLERGEPAEEGA